MKDTQKHTMLIRRTFWDYTFEPNYVIGVVNGELPEQGWFTKEYFLRRLMEMISWYDMIEIFGLEFMKEQLTDELIASINVPPVKERYELLKELLSGEPLSASGWSVENRERLQSKVLFKRWYSPE